MLSLSLRRDTRLQMIKLLLVAGLLAANAAIGLQWQRVPLALILAGAAGMVVALLALRDMPLALSLFVVSAATVSFTINLGTKGKMGNLNAAMMMVGLMAVIWLLRMTVARQFGLTRTPLNRPLLAFLAAAVVSWIYGLLVGETSGFVPATALRGEAAQYGIFVLTAAVFLLGANFPVGERTLRLWTGFLIAAGLAVLAAGIAVQREAVLPMWDGGLFMWPAVLLLAQILFNHDADSKLRVLGLGGLLIWAYWVARVALEYKSIYVPAAIAFMILAFFKSRKLLTLLVAAGIVLVVAVGPARISGLLTAGEGYSAPIRLSLWADVFRLGSRSPLLGLGPANYGYYWSDTTFQSLSYARVSPYAFSREVYAPPAHNMFVDIFAETGVIGLGFFVWALVGGLRLGWQALQRPMSGFAKAYAHGVLAGFAAQIAASFLFAEWLLPYVYNLGLARFPQAAYAWLLLGTLAWVGTEGGRTKDEG